jgi:hypothetical protein
MKSFLFSATALQIIQAQQVGNKSNFPNSHQPCHIAYGSYLYPVKGTSEYNHHNNNHHQKNAQASVARSCSFASKRLQILLTHYGG